MAHNDKHSDSDFARLIGEVKRLDNDRVDLYQQKPRQQRRPPSSDRIAERSPAEPRGADTETRDSWFAPGLQKKSVARIKAGDPSFDARLDLHGFTLASAHRELLAFLDQAVKRHCRHLLIIHGKGYRSEDGAVIKPMVQTLLHGHPAVLGYCPAQPRDGGTGASYVYLQLKNEQGRELIEDQ